MQLTFRIIHFQDYFSDNLPKASIPCLLLLTWFPCFVVYCLFRSSIPRGCVRSHSTPGSLKSLMVKFLQPIARVWQDSVKLVPTSLHSIDAMVQVSNKKTVTQEKYYWPLSTSMKRVEYKECQEINFSSAKSLKRKLDKKITSNGKMDKWCCWERNKRPSRANYRIENEVGMLHRPNTAGCNFDQDCVLPWCVSLHIESHWLGLEPWEACYGYVPIANHAGPAHGIFAEYSLNWRCGVFHKPQGPLR